MDAVNIGAVFDGVALWQRRCKSNATKSTHPGSWRAKFSAEQGRPGFRGRNLSDEHAKGEIIPQGSVDLSKSGVPVPGSDVST
jgi:hypothetical protein